MLLKARWVVPISSPPIENGAIVIEGDRIVFVGAVSDLSRKPDLDLGDSTLLPGLINAHCHLEHSTRITPQPPLTLRGGGFTKWVREMSQVGIGLETSAAVGIDRLLRTGTTTVANHCNPETPSFETPFRRLPFWEVLGAAKDRAQASLKSAIKRARDEGGFVTPHSFYAVHKDALSDISSPLQSIHLLESTDEDQFLRTGTGPLADYVRERGGEISLPESPISPVPSGTLLIHGNYLTNDEIGALRDLNASVIHCPGSHRFFEHRRFPLEDLKRAGVRIALGTDSLASNGDLSMLREMRLLKESYPELDETEILTMATIDGARALKMDAEIGSIEVGKKADLIAVRGNVLKAEQAVFSMIEGKVIYSDV